MTPGQPRAAGLGAAGPFTIVATDLDGTLLRSDQTVSANTVRAIARVRGRGAAHIIVTGRPANACRPIFDALGYRGLAVCGQGGQLYDADNHRMLWSSTIDPVAARTVVELINVDVGDLLVAVCTAGLDGRFRCTAGYTRCDEWGHQTVAHRDALWDQPIQKVLLRHVSLDDAGLTRAAERRCGPAFTATLSHHGTVELLPTGITKASGLTHAARRLGLSASRSIAFGDMPNDIPMFAWAGYAVAVRNAHAAVRAAADEISAANDDDGVAQVLDRLFTAGS